MSTWAGTCQNLSIQWTVFQPTSVAHILQTYETHRISWNCCQREHMSPVPFTVTFAVCQTVEHEGKAVTLAEAGPPLPQWQGVFAQTITKAGQVLGWMIHCHSRHSDGAPCNWSIQWSRCQGSDPCSSSKCTSQLGRQYP